MSSASPAAPAAATRIAVGLSLLLAAGAAAALATCELPFTDLPQHAWTLAVLRDPAAYGDGYRVQLSALDTNSLWFILDRSLWAALGLTPRASLALGTWLAVLLTPLAMAIWSRALRGDAATGALLGWAATWSMPLCRGYLHYALSLPLGILALAIAAPGLRGWRGPVLALLLLVLFLLHAQAFAFVLGALGLQALLTGWRRLLPLLACVLPSGLLLGRWVAGNLVQPDETAPAIGSLQGGLGARFDSLSEAIRGFPNATQAVLSGPGLDDVLSWSLPLLGLCGAVLALRRGDRTALAPLATALVAVVLYLALPAHIQGQFFISTRMAPWVALLLLPLATQPLPAPWASRRLVASALLAVTANASVLLGLARFSAEAAPLSTLLTQIPPAQRLMLGAPSRSSAVFNTRPYTHMLSWYAAESPGASTTFSFAEFRPNPVVYSDPVHTHRSIPGEEFRSWCTAFAGEAEDVTYVVTRAGDGTRPLCGAVERYSRQLRPITRSGEWTLYRVITPLPGQAGVDCSCPGRG